MQQFQITLKNEKARVYILLSRVVVILHIIIFLALVIFSDNKVVKWTCIASLVLLVLIFILSRVIKRIEWQSGLHVLFLILMLTWINMHQYWMAAIPLVFDILFTIFVRRLLVIVSKDYILYPSVVAKKIKWDMLNNVMIKDNLLTIDFKNNKLIQQPVDDFGYGINEKEFNEFCSQQLKAAASSI